MKLVCNFWMKITFYWDVKKIVLGCLWVCKCWCVSIDLICSLLRILISKMLGFVSTCVWPLI